jgi:hypothetical protein
MFTLPTVWNLIISTLVFIAAAWYLHLYLDKQGVEKGMSRKLLVFVLASLVSWGSGEVVDWVQGPQATAQAASDPMQLLKTFGQ